MKIRVGFISNSSSSSFIVSIKDLTQYQIDKLLSYGFTYTQSKSPYRFYYTYDSQDLNTKIGDYLGYYVSINELDAVEFLTEEVKCSFEACIERGIEHYSYDVSSGNLTVLRNYGVIYNMYGKMAYDILNYPKQIQSLEELLE